MNQDDAYLNAHEKEYAELLRKSEERFKNNNQPQSKVMMIETEKDNTVIDTPSTNQNMLAVTNDDINTEVTEKMTELENKFKSNLNEKDENQNKKIDELKQNMEGLETKLSGAEANIC